jgi:cell division protein FtsN
MSGDKGKVIAGVFIGMVLGIAAAGAVAWYVLNKKPNSYLTKENKDQAKPAAQVAMLPASSVPIVIPPLAESGVPEPKQHFEFYKELTDKSDNTVHSNQKAVQKAPVAAAKQAPIPSPSASKENYFLQAGSFQKVEEAEKLKAKLALSGYEATLQTVTIPDKGVWHRVRLGPYNSNEAGKTIAALRQNGIIATQLHVQ